MNAPGFKVLSAIEHRHQEGTYAMPTAVYHASEDQSKLLVTPNGWIAFKELPRVMLAIETALLNKRIPNGAPREFGRVTMRTGASYKYINVRIDMRDGNFTITDMEGKSRVATADLVALFPKLTSSTQVEEDRERDLSAFVEGHYAKWLRNHGRQPHTETYFHDHVRNLTALIFDVIAGKVPLEDVPDGIDKNIAAKAVRYFG